MKRRDFLKLTGSVGAGVVGGLMPTLKLQAAHDGYTGPLVLTIEARGGWDPTSLCDPKGNGTANERGQAINKFSAANITTMAGTGTGVGDELFYAPPAPIHVGNASLFTNQAFFTNHASRMLVINGVDNRTTSHSNGRRNAWSGELVRNAYPNIGALVAGTVGRRRGIPFISNGGYDETSGLVAPTRLNSNGIRALFEIAYPDRLTPDNAGSGTYFSPAVQQMITQARDTRHQQLLANQRLVRLQQALGDLISARADPGHLKDMTMDLTNRPESTEARLVARSRARDLYRQGRIALSAYETGVSAAAHLTIGGFDTHSNHDQNHYPRMMDMLMGVDAIIQEINARGLQDRVVIVMTSDFGRTNRYNGGDGKDHWRVTSAMFWAAPSFIQGNRCIGTTEINHKAEAILAVQAPRSSATNIIVRPAHIHNAMRKMFGVDGLRPEFRLANTEVTDGLDLFGRPGDFGR